MITAVLRMAVDRAIDQLRAYHLEREKAQATQDGVAWSRARIEADAACRSLRAAIDAYGAAERAAGRAEALPAALDADEALAAWRTGECEWPAGDACPVCGAFVAGYGAALAALGVSATPAPDGAQ